MYAPLPEVAKRVSERYMFGRRGMITAGDSTIQVKTVDVSASGFGVIASEPVKVGKPCSLILNSVVAGQTVQQTFFCETVYCILSGTNGFRIGLHLSNTTDLQKQQLQKILAGCFK